MLYAKDLRQSMEQLLSLMRITPTSILHLQVPGHMDHLE